MGNYFVLDSKFTPYTFEELIKPYQMYNEAYKEQEAAIDAAAEKEFMASDLSGDNESIAGRLFNKATEDLRSVSNELATKGLVQGIRGRIKDTARDYRRTMGILNNAHESMVEERNRRAKLGDNYVFQQSNLKLDDFLNGNVPNQRGVDLTKLTKDVAVSFSNRAKSISRDTWDKLFDAAGKEVKGYYDVSSTSGLTMAEVDSIINGEAFNKVMTSDKVSDSEKAKLAGFRQEILNKMSSIGYDNFDSQYAKDAISQAIREGATYAIGETKHSYQKDNEYINASDRAHLYLQGRAQTRADEQWKADPNNPDSIWYKDIDKSQPDAAQKIKERKEAITGKGSKSSGNKSAENRPFSPYTVVHPNGKAQTFSKIPDEGAQGDVLTVTNAKKYLAEYFQTDTDGNVLLSSYKDKADAGYKEHLVEALKKSVHTMAREMFLPNPETATIEDVIRAANENGYSIYIENGGNRPSWARRRIDDNAGFAPEFRIVQRKPVKEFNSSDNTSSTTFDENAKVTD